MGFNRVTWTPGHDRKPVGASRFRGLARLRRERETRARQTAAAHALPGNAVSLVINAQVLNGFITRFC